MLLLHTKYVVATIFDIYLFKQKQKKKKKNIIKMYTSDLKDCHKYYFFLFLVIPSTFLTALKKDFYFAVSLLNVQRDNTYCIFAFKFLC